MNQMIEFCCYRITTEEEFVPISTRLYQVVLHLLEVLV